MIANLVALIAGPSVQSMVLENNFAAKKQDIKRYASFDLAKRDPDVDVIMIEDILVHSDLPDTEAVVIGIDPRPYKIQNYDAVLYYPVKWEQFVEVLDANKPKIFDPNVRKQIEELLGLEAYRQSLTELIEEISGAIDGFEQKPFDEQISIVHKISGVSAMLGVRDLHHALLAIEITGKSGDKNGFDNGWKTFIAEWPENREEIRSFIVA